MPTSPGQLERQKQARQAMMDKGWSSDCARSMHQRCHLESCPCSCHRGEPGLTGPRSAETRSEGARKAWATRRAGTGTAGETAPKRPEFKTGHKSPIPAAAAKQIKSTFGFALWTVDGVVAGAERIPQWTPEDRLQPAELSAFVDATYNEIEARAPWLLRYLAKAQESAPEAALIYTVAMIALPRLARREAVIMGMKITPEFARAVVLAPIVAQSVAREQSASGLESVPTPQSDRSNGNGQIDVGGASFEGTPVQAGPSVQTGFGAIRHGPSDQNGAWANGHAP